VLDHSWELYHYIEQVHNEEDEQCVSNILYKRNCVFDQDLNLMLGRFRADDVYDLEDKREVSNYIKKPDHKFRSCSFIDNETYTGQNFYNCEECGYSACFNCAMTCHKGHHLSSPRWEFRFYCDCGDNQDKCVFLSENDCCY
jgi:hypothetical protein